MRLQLTQDDHKALVEYLEETRATLNRTLGWQADPTTGDGWHDESFARVSNDAQRLIADVRSLEDLVAIAEVVIPEEQNFEIALGSGVVLQRSDKTEMVLLVTGYAVGERGMELVSTRTPLGQALLGKHWPETVQLPNGETLRIIDILSPSEVKSKIESEKAMGKPGKAENDSGKEMED